MNVIIMIRIPFSFHVCTIVHEYSHESMIKNWRNRDEFAPNPPLPLLSCTILIALQMDRMG